jgi:Pyruvate/2-oxoglutarate dehydrogenase complex, dihydrolipoamide acyltransferase (E2) component, and related enzymes
MISTLIMPQGGQDLETGIILKWLKKEGDAVAKGDVVCEVETEKAVIEVEAQHAGVLLKILAKEQEEVKILAPIGYIGEKGDQLPDSREGQPAEPAKPQASAATASIASPSLTPNAEKLKISPKARKLAKDNQISLDSLGESLGGLDADKKITAEDLQGLIQGSALKADSSAGQQDFTLQPLNAVRKTGARRMAASWSTVPHIFVTVAVDMTEAAAFRKAQAAYDLSYNDMIIYACVQALRTYPVVNSSYIEDGQLRMWQDVNIGLAVNTPEGLIVPIIEDADRLSLRELSDRSKAVIEKIRAGKQAVAKPARFTVSNLGMYNVEQFTAIINPPEAAILAVSTIRKLPVVAEDDRIVVRSMMNLTLSIDHRIGTGVTGAEFLNKVKRVLEEPQTMNF